MSSSDPVAQMRRLATVVRRGLYRGMSQWASGAVRALKTASPRSVRRSVLYRATGAGGAPRVHLFVADPVGAYLEYGTGIYGPSRTPITSRGEVYTDARGQTRPRVALRWVAGGREWFRRSVRGVRPRPWFWPTLKRQVPMLRDVIASAVYREVSRSAGRSGRAGA